MKEEEIEEEKAASESALLDFALSDFYAWTKKGRVTSSARNAEIRSSSFRPSRTRRSMQACPPSTCKHRVADKSSHNLTRCVIAGGVVRARHARTTNSSTMSPKIASPMPLRSIDFITADKKSFSIIELDAMAFAPGDMLIRVTTSCTCEIFTLTKGFVVSCS